MDANTLHERQKWTLEQKIDHAVGTIEAFIARTGKTPYVSFSGGKDSTVVLDLVRRFIDPDIKAVFCNTGNEFPEIVEFVKTWDNVTIITPGISIKNIIEEHGFPLLSKETAQGIREAKTTKSEKLLNIRLHGTDPSNGLTSGKIANKWQYLIKEPFMVSEQCCDILKKRPFKRYQRETGEVPILGVMADESRLRMQQYIIRGGCNSFRDNHIASYPISIWLDDDIYAYLKKFDVPYCKLYDDPRCKRTGCMFCGFGAQLEKLSRFEFLYELHPKLYNIFMKYQNNGVSYRDALRTIGIHLPDDI